MMFFIVFYFSVWIGLLCIAPFGELLSVIVVSWMLSIYSCLLLSYSSASSLPLCLSLLLTRILPNQSINALTYYPFSLYHPLLILSSHSYPINLFFSSSSSSSSPSSSPSSSASKNSTSCLIGLDPPKFPTIVVALDEPTQGGRESLSLEPGALSLEPSHHITHAFLPLPLPLPLPVASHRPGRTRGRARVVSLCATRPESPPLGYFIDL
jgi:hypothetical protein